MTTINQGSLMQSIVVLPPLVEQHAIANALHTLKEAREARQRELALELERKAALMQYLFTHGPWGERRKQTEIGDMPESWEIVPLRSIFYTQLGKMLSKLARRGTNPKPYMRNANVQWGKLDCSEVFEMDFSEREAERFRLRSGDILICEGGEIGRTAIWRDELPECYFQKAIHRLRPRDNSFNPLFFMYWMERAFRLSNIYGIAGTKTTIAHLPQEKLEAMKIPKPAIEVQENIVLVLEGCDTKIEALKSEVAFLDELFETSLEELMTGRLSVLPLIESEAAA